MIEAIVLMTLLALPQSNHVQIVSLPCVWPRLMQGVACDERSTKALPMLCAFRKVLIAELCRSDLRTESRVGLWIHPVPGASEAVHLHVFAVPQPSVKLGTRGQAIVVIDKTKPGKELDTLRVYWPLGSPAVSQLRKDSREVIIRLNEEVNLLRSGSSE